MTEIFDTTKSKGRGASRNPASSSEAITIADEKKKTRYYRPKAHAAWEYALPGIPCPGSETDASLLLDAKVRLADSLTWALNDK